MNDLKTSLIKLFRPNLPKVGLAMAGFLVGLFLGNLVYQTTAYGFPVPIWYNFIGGCPQVVGGGCFGGEKILYWGIAADIIIWYLVGAIGFNLYRRRSL